METPYENDHSQGFAHVHKDFSTQNLVLNTNVKLMLYKALIRSIIIMHISPGSMQQMLTS
jgi:hypothetical protein